MLAVSDNLAQCFEALRGHKLRASLTALGLTMGVATLITVMTIVQGANLYVEQKIANMGTNVFQIARTPFAVTDFTIIIKALKYKKIETDAIIPLSNFKKEYPGSKELVMAFTVPKNVSIDLAQGEVIQAMRRLRRVPPEKENDFELGSPDFLSNLWNQLTGALVILTTVISSIGLLVGGIGVMNIMLISVTERTQEIGVRKAIGARRADIRLQFLLEAVVLTLVGGTIGILIGAGISVLVRTLVPSIPASLSYLWVSIGFAISVGVGLFFGYYPARVAANPIDCLSYE